ncbi:MAG: sugar ABC transporter permease [Oscillospiraceae bacterium]|nr:sugar ABC transporter permease [Oscillospiraceae bacterium]
MKRKTTFFTLERKRAMTGYLFALPWLLGFLLFMLYPFVTSFMLSIGEITDLEGLQMKFAGFGQYVSLIAGDAAVEFAPALAITIWNTFINVPLILVISLTVSLLVSRKLPGKGIFRLIFFLPVLLGAGYAMEQIGGAGNILQVPENIFRYIRFYLNMEMATFLEELLMQVIGLFWRSGVQIVIFIGGIQAIPDTYYEAAMVDNANSWDALWKITLPMLSPMIFLNLVYTVIDSFRSLDNPITALIRDKTMRYNHYELGSAMGWLYFAVAFLFVGVVAIIFRRTVYYEK